MNILKPPAPLNPGDKSILALVGIAILIGQYDFSILTLALPDVQRSFDVSEETVGSIIGIARLGAIPAVALALLSDRIGRRQLLLWTLLGFSLFTFATGFAPRVEYFVAFQFLARVFTSAEEALAVVFILETARDENRGWSVGFLAAMGALGAGFASLAYGFVEYLPGGWRGLYVAGSVPVLYVAWLRRRLPETKMFEEVLDSSHFSELWKPVHEILKHHKMQVFILALATALFWFQMSPAFNFMSKYLQDSHGYGPGAVATLFIVAGGFALVGNLLAGSLSDHIGRRFTIIIAIAINASALLWFYNTSGHWLPVAWILALIGFFAVDVVLKAVSAEVFPTHCRSTASTGLTIFSVIAVAAGFVAEGHLYSLMGSHSKAISLMIPISVLVIPLVWLGVRETARQKLE
ncbi:MAG: MFS transporter [Parasphingorhabdus sp.]